VPQLQQFLDRDAFLAKLEEVLIVFGRGASEEVELPAFVEAVRVLADELGLEDCVGEYVRVESEESTFSYSADRISSFCSAHNASSAERHDCRSTSLTDGELRLTLNG
jgi:hypothetical protein